MRDPCGTIRADAWLRWSVRVPPRPERSKNMRKTLLTMTALIALTAFGCSDDVVCPGVGPDETVPHIAASLSESSIERTAGTHAELVCAADPLPTLLISFINGRELSDVGSADGLGLRAAFDDDDVLWSPGVPCSLEVTTDFGYATSSVTVPEAAQADAPPEGAVAETLTVSWEAAVGADYYRLTATLVPEAGQRGGHRDTLEFSKNTRATSVQFGAGELAFPGVLSGVVESVAGPFPEGGAEGNVGGDGSGFFSVRFADQGSAFNVVIHEPLDSILPSK
jgi:hypothetical protein